MRKRKLISVVLVFIIIQIFFINSLAFASNPVITSSQIEKAIEWAYDKMNSKTSAYNGWCLKFVSDAWKHANLAPAKVSKTYG